MSDSRGNISIVEKLLVDDVNSRARQLFEDVFSGCILGEVRTSSGSAGFPSKSEVIYSEVVTESIVPESGAILGTIYENSEGKEGCKCVDRVDYAITRILAKMINGINERVGDKSFFVRRWPEVSRIAFKVFNDDSTVSIVVEAKFYARLYLR